MNKKEVFIKNPARALKSYAAPEQYVPEYQRLMAEGKISGPQLDGELSLHQAQLRNQIIKEMQMTPKLTVPTVGQKDIGWNSNASFYDEPLAKQPIYDDNLVREDLTNEELDKIYDNLSKKEIQSDLNSKTSTDEKEDYIPPKSLGELSSNEIIIIVEGQVLFSSLNESLIKEKIAKLIFQDNLNPNSILVIKRLPISISINIE